MTRQDLAVIQAAYYGVTGIWPMVHLNSFLRVTGPKVDLWLVRCVALLITVIALSLLAAGLHGEPEGATFVLAVGSAVALGSLESYYAVRGTISKIYLGDTVIELLLLLGWLVL